MDYWQKKAELAARALEHTEAMQKEYSEEIRKSVIRSKVLVGYSLTESVRKRKVLPEVSFERKTSVDALFALPEDASVCVLNFASYKMPGGMFLKGSSAQEESLCHASFLYNVLSRFGDYYAWNNQHKKNGLYQDRAIVSPDVRFFSGEKTRMAMVLTCAAPNRSQIRYGRFTEEENALALARRLAFLVKCMNSLRESPETWLIGAFGCGVFQQSPSVVAENFARAAVWLTPKVKKLVVAIPDSRNYEPFKKAWEDTWQRMGKEG